MADRAMEFFRSIGDRPFYLHMGFSDPHRDFGNYAEYPDYDEIRYHPDEIPVPDFLPDHPDVRAELAEYYQSISRLDAGYGRAVEVLEKSGRADDTMIIVMSDHGMPFPGAKGSSFDSGHRLPLDYLPAGRECGRERRPPQLEQHCSNSLRVVRRGCA